MKRHRLLPLIVLLGFVLFPSAATAERQQQVTVPDWVQARLAEKKGEDVALIFGTTDHAVGDNRISFLVVRSNGSLVRSPQAKVLILREGATRGVQATARLISLEPEDAAAKHRHAEPDATIIYVVRVPLQQPGRYWMIAEPEGTTVQGFQSIDVRKRPRSPSVGSTAVASKNPTLRDGPAATITTARPPDFSLLRYSIAGSLAAHAPFVVVFATPKYCSSRTCGPAVETLEAAQKRFARSGIRFIHVEVYQDNNPGRGLNKWMREWHLPTEPWVFVVDRRGIIRDKFEGAIALPELISSISTHLR
jgi:hypothetical protein